MLICMLFVTRWALYLKFYLSMCIVMFDECERVDAFILAFHVYVDKIDNRPCQLN